MHRLGCAVVWLSWWLRCAQQAPRVQRHWRAGLAPVEAPAWARCASDTCPVAWTRDRSIERVVIIFVFWREFRQRSSRMHAVMVVEEPCPCRARPSSDPTPSDLPAPKSPASDPLACSSARLLRLPLPRFSLPSLPLPCHPRPCLCQPRLCRASLRRSCARHGYVFESWHWRWISLPRASHCEPVYTLGTKHVKETRCVALPVQNVTISTCHRGVFSAGACLAAATCVAWLMHTTTSYAMTTFPLSQCRVAAHATQQSVLARIHVRSCRVRHGTCCLAL